MSGIEGTPGNSPIDSPGRLGKAFAKCQMPGPVGVVLLAGERGVRTGVVVRVAWIGDWLGIDWIRELH